jgi:FMN-dependent NADH-azoreductase
MSTLLHIDSSPLYGRSVSRELTAAFVTQWKASHPDGRVIDRDLNATAIPPINAEWVGAAYTPEQARTSQQKELLSLSDSLLAELEQADEYVIGVPMHNFGVPSVLKLWIDQIARVGRTFSYGDGRPKGLIIGKKATFIIATGGIYPAQIIQQRLQAGSRPGMMQGESFGGHGGRFHEPGGIGLPSQQALFRGGNKIPVTRHQTACTRTHQAGQTTTLPGNHRYTVPQGFIHH